MTKFVTLNPNGTASAFFDDKLHKNIPADAVTVSDTVWAQWVSDPSKWVWRQATNTIVLATKAAAGQQAGVKPETGVEGEHAKRVRAVISASQLVNLTAHIAAGLATTPEAATFKATIQWLNAMRGTAAKLQAAGATEAPDDGQWPAPPTNAAALAAKF